MLPVLLLFSTFAGERQRRIDNALELSSAYRGTAMLLGDVIEADDAYTGTHSRDVVDLVIAVADKLELAPRDRRRAEFAALLHDIGKVKIPAEAMLGQIGRLLGEVGQVVRSCHERWDGAGYPDRVAGEAIPARGADRLRVRCMERDDVRPLLPQGPIPGGSSR